MAAFSVELCKERVRLWLDAEESVATGQRYQIGNRMLTRADLSEVREQLKYWTDQLAKAETEAKGRGRNRLFQVIQRDI